MSRRLKMSSDEEEGKLTRMKMLSTCHNSKPGPAVNEIEEFQLDTLYQASLRHPVIILSVIISILDK